MLSTNKKQSDIESGIISSALLEKMNFGSLISPEKLGTLQLPLLRDNLKADVFLVKQQPEAKPEAEKGPSIIVDPAIRAEKRAALKKTYDEAIAEVLKHNKDAKDVYKADGVKVVITENIKDFWREVASQTKQQDPTPPKDLCGFTLTVGNKGPDGKLKLTSIVFIDKSVLDSMPHGMEVLNHELRHVIDTTAKNAGNLKQGNPNEREAYAYSKTVEDLTKIRDAWTKEGKDPAIIKILEERIAVQAKLAEEYKAKK